MTAPALIAEGVTRTLTRGQGVVFSLPPVNLMLAPGELLAVIGASLSGKTTLLHMLAGWDEPDSGSVVWPSCSASPPAWDELRVIPQELALVEELTVEENVTLAERVTGSNRADTQVEALLDSLGLARLRNRGVGEISVGERQRVMVARALVGTPRIVVADEPTAHQDRLHGAAVLTALKALTERGAAVVLATRHEDVAAAADRVIHLGPSG